MVLANTTVVPEQMISSEQDPTNSHRQLNCTIVQDNTGVDPGILKTGDAKISLALNPVICVLAMSPAMPKSSLIDPDEVALALSY